MQPIIISETPGNASSISVEPDESVNGVVLITLKNNGVSLNVTNLGCTIVSLFTPDKNGIKKNIVAGFEDLNSYLTNEHYLGCILGRYTGRIAKAKFNLNGKVAKLSANENGNHLHGGFSGFNKKVWHVSSYIKEEDKVGVVLNYTSIDGEEGYPGNLDVKVTYLLDSHHTLKIFYEAVTDKLTPVSLSNHSYFNLTGFEFENIKSHQLQINADKYFEKREDNTVSGEISSSNNTIFNFSIPKAIGADLDQSIKDKGYDSGYILKEQPSAEVLMAAKLFEPSTGITLTVFTDQPVIHIYTANFWDGAIKGIHGNYQYHGAIAIETQAYPDAPNHLSFPSAFLKPGEKYFTQTHYHFGIE